MGEIFLVICFIAYFLYDQFQFKKVSRIRFLILPAFAIFQTINHFQFSWENLLLLLAIILIAWLVGSYQTRSAEVTIVNFAKYYYRSEVDHTEKPIYKKELHAKGGKSYLFGWLLIFGIQLFIEVLRGVFSSHEVWSEFFGEILRDIFIAYRIFDHNSQWYIWALYAASNSIYVIQLCRKHPRLKQALLEKETID